MAEYSVKLHPALLQKVEDAKAIKAIEQIPDFDGKSDALRMIRCFSRRGVPVRVVLEVINEVSMEGRANDG